MSGYATEMVVDIMSRMSLFVAGLSRLSRKVGQAAMLIGDMDISWLMVYVQRVEEEKLINREELKNKRAKTGNESGQKKKPAQSSAGALAPRNKGEYNGQNSRAKPAYSQGSVVQWGSKPPACAKCGRNHSGICREGSTSCFKCGQTEHFMRKCPTNKQGSEIVYRDCPIFINHKSTMADLIELDMVNFDVILGMDWLHACYASVDCRTRVAKFQFPNETVLEWKSSSAVLRMIYLESLLRER
ncbi:hypothetical protein H5410_055890 [Solanum commersonii]|uniref:CCHC-type domain-containing protein n=1 Tax=Solanum commersonii TaxID=4109 RepID=A0A9J5WKP8_SOLCO|nr:hypothetical protein H5410_055890 [Solanum commersonii]